MSYFDDASLVMIPSGYKDQKVYSVKPTDGSGDLTFSRASNATRVNSSGLVEKVRTNLALYSEQFDNAYWTKSQATITANATTAPDGTLTAEKFVEGSGSVTPECSRTPIATSNSIFTLSVFAKASERNFLIINNNNGLGSNRTWFNLTTGVIGTTAAGSTAYIENVGNGWYRCSVSHLISNFGSATSAFQIGSADGVQTYTGDGTSGIFIWGAQMELSDFGPTDYIATTSAAVSVGPVSGLPRLDYSGGCPSLLLEPQRTNSALYSEQADNSYWLKYQCSVTANQGVSPDGYTNADLLTMSANGIGVIYRNISTAGAVSCFMKSNSLGTGNFYISVDGVGEATWDANGVKTNTPAAGTSYDGVSYGNGWYRFTYVVSSGTTINFGIAGGTTGDSILLWGMQNEASSSYATSYIPTLSSAVTKVADAASKTGISSLIGQSEGTLFAEFEVNPLQDSLAIWTRNSATGFYGNMIYLGTNSSNQSRAQIVSGSTVQADIVGSTMTAGFHKFAVAYKNNDFAFYVDGALVGTDSSGSVPVTMDELYIDSYIDGGTRPASKKQVLLFKTRLSNADLATLTTL